MMYKNYIPINIIIKHLHWHHIVMSQIRPFLFCIFSKVFVVCFHVLFIHVSVLWLDLSPTLQGPYSTILLFVSDGISCLAPPSAGEGRRVRTECTCGAGILPEVIIVVRTWAQSCATVVCVTHSGCCSESVKRSSLDVRGAVSLHVHFGFLFNPFKRHRP